MSRFNINSIRLSKETEGPGSRLAIWFQGCSFGCDNCMNSHMHSYEPKNIISLEELKELIDLSVHEHNIEGVTLLGGEPLDQAHLIELLIHLKEKNLGVILFTGYLLEDISDNLLVNVDLLIDGKYNHEERIGGQSLVGSSNQRVIRVTNRYSEEDLFVEYTDLSVIGDKVIISGTT